MRKIKLLYGNGWIDADGLTDPYSPREDPTNDKFFGVISKTKNDNLVTAFIRNKQMIYRISTQEEIDFYNNKDVFPPEEEK